jgi:dienelactone hydrolase
MRWFTAGIAAAALVAIAPVCSAQDNKKQALLRALGDFPAAPALELKTLESVRIPGGRRDKIEYLAEAADPRFNLPADRVRAYLFVPDRQDQARLPGIVAIHQDGPLTHIGKMEPAGLAGQKDQHYGLELFQRGYVVICPDRYYHAERRPLADAATANSDSMRDLSLWLRRAGLLTLAGRTHMGKEVYDLMRAVDALSTYQFVDMRRIGAIGHSAGGNALVYFMFVDDRIRAGVSSAGFFDLMDFFDLTKPGMANPVFALPGLTKIGKAADYAALIAPRALLMTRGNAEAETEAASQRHVWETKAVEEYVRAGYVAKAAGDRFRVLYFDGGHEFPDAVKRDVYPWLDSMLKTGGPGR